MDQTFLFYFLYYSCQFYISYHSIDSFSHAITRVAVKASLVRKSSLAQDQFNQFKHQKSNSRQHQTKFQTRNSKFLLTTSHAFLPSASKHFECSQSMMHCLPNLKIKFQVNRKLLQLLKKILTGCVNFVSYDSLVNGISNGIGVLIVSQMMQHVN